MIRSFRHTKFLSPATSPTMSVVWTTAATLRAAAGTRGFKIGTAVDSTALAGGGTYTSTLAAEYNSVTPENCMKFGATEPSQNSFTFTNADALVSFAQANGMAIHGHNLVWVDYLPAWVTGGSFSKAQLQAVMQNHINTVMDRYAGQIECWDVVNEPLDSSGNYRGGAGTWYAVIGTDYVDNAFTYARAADPTAKLYINDDGIYWGSGKADAYYTLISSMISRGIPIDGVGFQCHLALDSPKSDVVRTSMQRFADLGLDVRVTELDIRISDGAGASAIAAQAAEYGEILDACLRVSRCTGLTTWGFTDAVGTSVPDSDPGYGRAKPFDSSYAKKSAYDTMLARFNTPTSYSASPTLWTSGLENEDNTFSEEWSRSTVEGSNTLTVGTGVTHAGTNAAVFTFAGTSKVVGTKKSIWNTPGEIWVRAYVRINTTYAGATDDAQNIVFDICSGIEVAQARLVIQTQAGANKDKAKWVCTLPPTNTIIYLGTPSEITKDTWFKVAIHFKAGSGANGGAEFFLNDVSKGSNFTLNLSTVRINQLRLGQSFSGGSGLLINGSIRYVDDVAYDLTDPGA